MFPENTQVLDSTTVRKRNFKNFFVIDWLIISDVIIIQLDVEDFCRVSVRKRYGKVFKVGGNIELYKKWVRQFKHRRENH